MSKYQKGDHVHVAKDLGSRMSHFECDCQAIVISSSGRQYTIYIKGKGEVSWYRESQLELLEKNRIDLLGEWKLEVKAEARIKGELDWIFERGDEVLKAAHGSTVEALAKCFGLTDLWGSGGEGFVYYQNAMATLEMAKPYLEGGDKEGWLEFCAEVVASGNGKDK